MTRTTSRTIQPFLVMDILEKAQILERSGHKVIHLEIGQPDFPTPECVTEAAARALRDGKTSYTHSLGILPLREAIAEYYASEYGASVSPEQIVISSGSSPAMLMLFDALCEQGEGVIVSDPAYACYGSFIRNAGGVEQFVPVKEEEGFQLRPAAVETAVAPHTRAILVNSPSNPAGTILSSGDMRALAELARPSRTHPEGLMLVSDEIYHGLAYEGRAASVLEFTDNCCVVDGFSKRYAMTGWRLGWLVAPRAMLPTLQAMQQNFFICAGSIAQWAGIAAIREAAPDVRRMADAYNRRRLVLIDLLRPLGLDVKSSPAGAFYVLVNARHLSPDSLALANDILEKAHVGVAPGIDFGQGAEGYLRFSYANSVENIQEAMCRLKKYLEDR